MSLEDEVLEAVKQRPDFKIKLGNRMYSRQEIIDNWKTDGAMRRELVSQMMGLKLHDLVRRPPE